jgi:hypothetical protein
MVVSLSRVRLASRCCKCLGTQSSCHSWLGAARGLQGCRQSCSSVFSRWVGQNAAGEGAATCQLMLFRLCSVDGREVVGVVSCCVCTQLLHMCAYLLALCCHALKTPAVHTCTRRDSTAAVCWHAHAHSVCGCRLCHTRTMESGHRYCLLTGTCSFMHTLFAAAGCTDGECCWSRPC